MSAPKYNLPKDTTNPLMYVPIAVASVVIVGWVFGSGYLHGIEHGKEEKPLAVVANPVKPVNVQALAEPTPELIAQGKSFYGTYCASCHGVEGYGDGPNGKGLNPAPRNFHEASSTWTNGASVSQMWVTLDKGIAGSSMSSYAGYNAADRMAVIHYIRSVWTTDAPALSQADIDALPGPVLAATGPLDFEALGTDAPELELVNVALKDNVRPQSLAADVELPGFLKDHPAATLYGMNCAECHGSAGGGVKSRLILTSAPYVRISTSPFQGNSNPWVRDLDAFTQVITKTKEGTTRHHGFATFTTEQISDLHQFVQALTALGSES